MPLHSTKEWIALGIGGLVRGHVCVRHA
jgi:hypothetical protein